MAIHLNNDKSDLSVNMKAENGEVRLSFNGHTFLRLYTDEHGSHLVDIVDVDTGVRSSSSIPALCWRR